MFSILLMNAATPLIDRLTTPKPFGYRKPAKKEEKTKEEPKKEERKDEITKNKNE